MATQIGLAETNATNGASRADGLIAKKYLIVLAVMPSTIMEVLDTSVVNVSLPHIGGSLGASVSEATWVLTAYLIANAIVVPLGGWLSHRFGRRRLLLTIVTGFTVSSILCGLAPTLPLLVFFRILQGLTGGGLQPLSQSILLQEFPVHERQRAMAIWALGVVLAPILGPTLGGWITDTLSWRWVFFINVPIGILSWVLISYFIRDTKYSRDGKAASMDVIGISFLALGMAALQAMLDKGEQEDWFGSHLIVTLAIIAAVFIPLFVIRELRAPNPFVRLRLFADWNFRWGSCIGFLMYSSLFGGIILVPLFMETVLGWTAGTTGIWTGPRGLGSLCGIILQLSPWSKRLKGSRGIASIGFAVTGCLFIFGYAHMDMNAGPWNFFWLQFIQGFAVNITFLPMVTTMMSYIKAEDMPYASALYGSVRNIGSSVGISFVAIMLDRRNQFHQVRLGEQVLRQNIHCPIESHCMALLYRDLLAQANLMSLLDLFRIFGIVLIAISWVPLVIKRPPHDT